MIASISLPKTTQKISRLKRNFWSSGQSKSMKPYGLLSLEDSIPSEVVPNELLVEDTGYSEELEELVDGDCEPFWKMHCHQNYP